MAEYVTRDPKPASRDTVGLVAGVIFAAIGLGYLIGGNHALSDHWGVLLPAVLVLLGLTGLAGSGLIRGAHRATGYQEPPVSRDEAPAPEPAAE